MRFRPLVLRPYLIQQNDLDFRSKNSKDTNPIFFKHQLRLFKPPTLSFWGTKPKSSNLIFVSASILVSWGLWSSRTPTPSFKALTLSLRGSNSQLRFLKMYLVLLHGSQYLIQQSLSILAIPSLSLHVTSSKTTLLLTWRCHHCSSCYANKTSSRSPHDGFNASRSSMISTNL